jgi:hypothetical protein
MSSCPLSRALQAHVIALLSLPSLPSFWVSGGLCARVFLAGRKTLRSVFVVSRLGQRSVTLNTRAHPPALLVDVNARVLGGVFVALWAMGTLSEINTASSTTLSISVSNVVGVRTEKKMRWVDAGGVVAVVADLHVLGNRPVVDFPRNAVRGHDLPIKGEASIAPLMMSATSPLPTALGLLNLSPKTLLYRLHSVNLTQKGVAC